MRRYLFLLSAVMAFLTAAPFRTGAEEPRTWSIPVITDDNKTYASLHDIVTIAGAGHTFDPIVRRGRLFRKEHQAVFIEGCSLMIIDGILETGNDPVIHKKNETLIPEQLFLAAALQLFPEFKITKKEDRFYAALHQKPAEKPADERTEKKSRTNETIKKTAVPEHDAAPLPQSAPEKIGFIILDAGHGGKDPGAVGKGKTYEKHITLDMVKKVGALLAKEHKNIKIFYTRSDDTFIELGMRTEIANRKLTRNTNGLFISIHVNASVVPKMNGYETYFLSQNPTNAEARSTAALENDVVVLENPGRRKSYDDVEYIEALMVTTQIQKESRMLAEKIQGTMSHAIKEFPSRGVKTADFFVLRGSLMPAALVEIGYITNKKEMEQLKTDSYQQKIAETVADGIGAFLKAYDGK